MIEGFKEPTKSKLDKRSYNSSEFFREKGNITSLKNSINKNDNPDEVTEKVTTFFDKIAEKKDSKENTTRYSSAMNIFKKNKAKGIMKFLGGFFTQFFDGVKTSANGNNNPASQVDLQKFNKEESLQLYKNLIKKTGSYGLNPSNCTNAVTTASKTLDDSVEKNTEYKNSMEYLVKNKLLKKGDVIIVNSPDADLQSALTTIAIQGISNSIYTHTMIITEIYDDGDFTCIDSTNQRGGTQSIKWSEYCKKGTMDYMILDTPDIYAESVIAYCKKNIGKDYDLKSAVIDGITGKRGAENNEFYCSELYINACEASGMNIEKDIVSPGDIMKIVSPIYAKRQ